MVGEFIGTINVFEGQVDAADGTVRCAALPCPIALEERLPAGDGSAVAIGIRPEKMRIRKAVPDEPTTVPENNFLSGRVEDIAYLGDLSIFHVRLADGRIVQVSRTNTTRRRDEPLTWEDAVEVEWDPQAPVVLHQ